MRRHRLRDRIRHQRRLTRRLASRHVLILRPNSVARTLEALGAWTVEPLAPPSRFVPALMAREAEPVAAAADYLPPGMTTDVAQVTEGGWEDGVTGDTTADTGLDEPNVIAAPGQAPETPRRLPHAGSASTAAETGQRLAVPKADLPPADATTPSPRPAARAAGPRADAPRGDRRTARAATPLEATTETSAPTRQRLADVVPKPDEPVRRPSPQRAEPGLADSATATLADSPSVPTFNSGTPPVADRADAPGATSPEDGGERVVRAHADDVAAADSEPTIPADRTPHVAVVDRALAALRASGELPPPAAPTAKRTPPSHGPGPATRLPHAVASSHTNTRSTGLPINTSLAGAAVPVATPAREAAPSPASPPPPLSAASPTLSEQAEGSTPVEPPADVRSFDAPDATRSDTNAARSDGIAEESPLAPEDQSAPAAHKRMDAPSQTSRVDEQRQARRPAHLDRSRSAPATSSQTPAGLAATSPPASAGRAPASEGQFQFSHVERTIQDWQRLLFEATSPSRAASRQGTTPRDGRASAPAVASRRRVADDAPRPTPNDVTRPRAEPPPAVGTIPPRPAESTDPIGAAEPVMTPVTADEATSTADQAASAPDAGDDAPRAGVTSPTHVADIMRAIPAEPVSPSVRRFLRPLTGIDPDAVRVHRGERAGRLADQLRADAVAVGDDIAIGPGHDDRDPDTIALLAHELTHAARARDQRFVPPIARGGQRVDAGAADTASPTRTRGRGAARDAAPPNDEEALARLVETRVRAAAERVHDQAVTPNADLGDASDDDFAAEFDDGDVPTPIGRGEAERPKPPSSAAVPRAAASPWGALPAPWEPLPPSLIPGHPAHASATGSTAAVAAPSPSASSASPMPGPEVHLAEHGRSTASEEPAHIDAPGHGGPAAPDIDALARQVYSVLKRRLAAEQRRGA